MSVVMSIALSLEMSVVLSVRHGAGLGLDEVVGAVG